ncbi:hypothetical protein Tco_0165959, partial [Tanacetum coccineum]
MTFYVNGNLVTWASQKQRVVALSSCEAEFIAATMESDLVLNKVIDMGSCISESKSLVPWGWTSRLDIGVRASLVLGFPSISPTIVVAGVGPLSGKSP